MKNDIKRFEEMLLAYGEMIENKRNFPCNDIIRMYHDIVKQYTMLYDAFDKMKNEMKETCEKIEHNDELIFKMLDEVRY